MRLPGRRPTLALLAALAFTAAAVGSSGCGRKAAAPTARVWLMAGGEPLFDPDGPPDSRRWAIERLLTRGLLREDDAGLPIPDAAYRYEVSGDRLVYTFHLEPRLSYAGGSACRSADFKIALEAGLGRRDHSTRAWLLAAVRGVAQVRPGKELPALGIETPDDSTLVLRLETPDALLLRKLAMPGVSGAWKDRTAAGWKEAEGLGPYRALLEDPGRRVRLLRAGRRSDRRASDPDTVTIRFALPAARMRSLMRSEVPDLVWPIPPGLLDEPLPPGYRRATGEAHPDRRLLLVMRADLPPTTRLPTRHALGHGLNWGDLLRMLEPLGAEPAGWPSGGGRFELPNLDQAEVLRWMEQARLGRSFHVVMAYDPDGPAGMVARSLQGEWSRHAIYLELLPLRGRALAREALQGRAHLLLVDAQSLIDHPAGDLAQTIMPLRGPAAGSFRVGWRTREFDAWLEPSPDAAPGPVDEVKRRFEEELVVVPVAGLPWTWIERVATGAAGFSPRFGPRCAISPIVSGIP